VGTVNVRRVRSPQTAGFTLFELLAGLGIVGILAAIASVSFLGMVERGRVNEAANVLRGMIQTSQREAIKKSQDCIIRLPPKQTRDPVISSSCAATGDRQLRNVAIQYNQTNQIRINYQGRLSQRRTIVVYSNNTGYKRCLVVSNFIGMTRTGRYTNPSVATVSADFCQTTST
jgi:prepilin-type N-terminal cleavage/methylation domain-containing protein